MKRISKININPIIVILALAFLVGCVLFISSLAKYLKSIDGTPHDITIGATIRTVLFEDGTFLINEKAGEHANNVSAHGQAKEIYKALTDDNPYVFDESSTAGTQRPWKDKVADIRTVEIGSDITPISTAYWFSGCTNLSSINFENLDGTNVTSMRSMFENCSTLASVDTSEFDLFTQNLESAEALFKGCTSLEDVNLEELHTSTVTNMKSMFQNCSSMESIDLNQLSTDSVQNMDSMFAGCSAISEIDLTGFKSDLVNSAENMFAGCTHLTSIQATEDFDLSGLSTQDVFANCPLLKGGSGTTWDASRTSNAYAKIDQGGTTVETQGYFSTEPELWYYIDSGTLYISPICINENYYENTEALYNGNPYWLGRSWEISSVQIVGTQKTKIKPVCMDYWFEEIQSNSITGLNNDNFDTSKLESLKGTFELSRISSLDLSNFSTPKVTDTSSMFNECENLTQLKLDGLDTSNVTTMEQMFDGCRSLSELDLSNFNTGNVTNMKQMFYECWSLPELNVTSFDVGNVENMSQMFKECDGLRELNVGGFNSEKVKDMSEMFCGCEILQTINLSDFKTGNVINMSRMFAGCIDLPQLDLSSFNTENVENMSGMFQSSTLIHGINLSSFDTKKVKDMSEMFSRCDFTTLDISSFSDDSVENVTGMFDGCGSLVTIYATDNFDLSGKFDPRQELFGGCTNLKTRYTKWDSRYIDTFFARIPTNYYPYGYFTQK